MKASLWLRLVLPLAALSLASLYLHTKKSADGFFLNLATEFIGIIVTVAYVDWVLKTHERNLWRGTSARITGRLRFFTNAAVTSLRVALKFGTDVLDQTILAKNDPKLANAEVMRVGVHVLAPAVRSRLDSLDVAGWKVLADNILATWREAERMLDRFGRHLQPSEIETLLDIQQALESALTFWRTFPDIAGVPEAQLPQTTTDTLVLQASGYDSTAEELRKVLRLTHLLATQCNERDA